VKTCAHFKKAADATLNLDMAFGWFRDPGKNFQERTLTSAVASDDTCYFTLFYFKGNVVDCPDEVVIL